MKRFEGKVVLVTGAASGIGRATVERIASEGGRMWCVDVVADAAEASSTRAVELGVEAGAHAAEAGAHAAEAGAHAAEAGAHAADVSDPEQCRAAVRACVERFGRLDALVNMAGIIQMGHSAEFPQDAWNRVLAVNLSGTFYMCQAAIPSLLASKGSIVNAASTTCFRATPYAAAYAASKGGILALTRTLAVEYGKQGLRVNAVAPGSIRTAMAAPPGFPEDADWKLIQRSMALTGQAGPETVASAIAYLASDDGLHVNGEYLTVDGATLA
ncbi:MAG: SDR family oxidoreductase [Deltaproteobacteria bacterium]|nr:SDR family oxidoreductase [Deltaproteobacteria bacterium]